MGPQEALATYLDDRSFVTTTAKRAKDLTKLWQDWGNELGLKENAKKTKVIVAQGNGERRATKELFGEAVVRAIRVLGVDFGK